MWCRDQGLALLKNSHRPDHSARAEGDRREAIAFEVALVPVITSEDYATFKGIDTQTNMDIDSMLFSNLGWQKVCQRIQSYSRFRTWLCISQCIMPIETESEDMQGQERIVSVEEDDARSCKSDGQRDEGKDRQYIAGVCQSILSTILCWQRTSS